MEEEDLPVCNISETPLSFTSEFILNSFLHVTILFIFLNILFYVIIAPLSTSLARHEIGHQIIEGINKAIPKPINIDSNKMIDCNQFTDIQSKASCTTSKIFLNDYILKTPIFSTLNIKNVDDLNKTIYTVLTTNTDGNNILDNYILEYSTPNKLISDHNQQVVNYGINISVIFLIITIVLFIFLKYSCNKCINITKILIENIVTFTFIGGIEYWFFSEYASKFIPAPPSTLASTAINTVSSYLTATPSYPKGYKFTYSEK
jgi:hypothetical protein